MFVVGDKRRAALTEGFRICWRALRRWREGDGRWYKLLIVVHSLRTGAQNHRIGARGVSGAGGDYFLQPGMNARILNGGKSRGVEGKNKWNTMGGMGVSLFGIGSWRI